MYLHTYMTVIGLIRSHDSHMTVIGKSHDSHMTVVGQSHDSYRKVTHIVVLNAHSIVIRVT